MPAKSPAQKRVMCMALAYKKGDLKLTSKVPKSLKEKVRKLAKSMTQKQLKDYCK